MNIDFDKMIALSDKLQEKSIKAVIALNDFLPVIIGSLEQFKAQMEAAKEAVGQHNTLLTRLEMIDFIKSQLGDEINYDDWSDARVQAAYEELNRRQDGDGGNFAAVL